MLLPGKYTLHVTQDYIDAGRENSPWDCPLALAAEQLGEVLWIGGTNIWRKENNFFEPNAQLPAKTAYAIWCYDEGFGMVPGDYEIELEAKL